MWNSVQVAVGPTTYRGRYRMEGERLVLEWRGGREAARCGLLKPEIIAMQILRQQAEKAPRRLSRHARRVHHAPGQAFTLIAAPQRARVRTGRSRS